MDRDLEWGSPEVLGFDKPRSEHPATTSFPLQLILVGLWHDANVAHATQCEACKRNTVSLAVEHSTVAF